MNTAVQSLRLQLEPLRRAWRGSPLPRFFAWWTGELAALLPAAWRARFGGGASWFALERAGTNWQARLTGGGETLARWSEDTSASTRRTVLDSAMQRVEPEDRRLVLLLPPTDVLRRRLSLPEAAADNLQQIGAFEMDRQTPFRAEQVYYAVRELPEQTPGRLAAELVAVPRASVDPLLESLRGSAIAVDAVDVAQGHGRLGVNLLPAGQAPVHANPRRRLNLALAAAAALLLVLALAQWVHNRQQALATMQAQVDAMRTEAQQVAGLRQQLKDNAGAAGFLVARKEHTVSRLAVLRDLTERLPDSAWLERFTADNAGGVNFQGQSKQATRLIDTLKDSRYLVNPAFQGSIQPDPNTGRDRFFLTAQLRQPGLSGAPPARASSVEDTP